MRLPFMRMRGLFGGLHLGPYLRYLRLWILLAIIPAIIAAAIGYYRGNRGVPLYDASASLYVQESTSAGLGGSGLPDIANSSQLAQTYGSLSTQPIVAQYADRLLAKRYPGYRIEDHNLQSAQAGVQQQAPLFIMSVTDTSPTRAADAVNASAKAFITLIREINDSRFSAHESGLTQQLAAEKKRIDRVTRQIAKYSGDPAGLEVLKATLGAHQSTYQALLASDEQLKLARDEISNSVAIYSPATPPAAPDPKHPTRNAILYGFVVLLLCSGLIYAYEYLNDLPQSPEEVQEVAGAPVLGTVLAMGRRGSGGATSYVRSPRSLAAEAYRLIRTNLQFTDVDHPPRTIVVTSPQPEDGKTTTASNLAQVFAEGGMSVTLVDCDLRRPSLSKVFDVGTAEGVTNLVVGGGLNGQLHREGLHDNLTVIGSGPIPPNPADLLNSSRMRELLEHLRRRSDIVMVDSPPVLAVADAAILSTMVDGVVLVVDPNRTQRRDIREAREAIEAVGGRILGVVINRARAGTGLSYRYSGYYGARYGETPSAAASARPAVVASSSRGDTDA